MRQRVLPNLRLEKVDHYGQEMLGLTPPGAFATGSTSERRIRWQVLDESGELAPRQGGRADRLEQLDSVVSTEVGDQGLTVLG